MRKTARKTGFVFSHVHWDIEWYLPFRSFRFWLLQSLDRFVATAPRLQGFRCFVLDGQVAPLDHYLEVRPENEKAIRALVASGTLAVGPFYTQFDEWLTGPEAMVRNCRYGDRRARGYGRVMKAGYLPDNFGHPAQMPQILAGFGLDSLIFMRGMPDRSDEVGDQFWLAGPDGTRVLAVHLRNTYCNAHALGAAPGAFGPPLFRVGPFGEHTQTSEFLHRAARRTDLRKGVADIVAAARKAEPGCHTGVIPIANGYDSAVPQESIGEIINRANREQGEYEFVHGDLAELVQTMLRRGASLETLEGELWGGKFQYLLPGAITTRSYLKQANFACEALLERYAEPLAALATIEGGEWPALLLEEAWRWLFLNEAHDGIHGSSADVAHVEMVQRFDAARQIALGVAHEALAALAATRDVPAETRALVLAYSPEGAAGGPAVVDTWLHGFDPGRHVVVDARGRALPVQVLPNEWAADRESRAASWAPPWPDGNPTHLLVSAPLVAGEVAAWRVREGRPRAAEHQRRRSATTIENEHLRVRFARGALEVYDKASRRTYRGLAVIEDEADRGDAWDFSEPWKASGVLRSSDFPSTCRVAETGRVRTALEVTTSMRVPRRMDGEKRSRETVELPIVLRAALCRGARRVDVSIEIDNQARDHRLRVVCPTGLRSATVASQGHFCIMKRPVRNPDEGKEGWTQPPPTSFPFREWVAVSEDGCGLAVAVRGLYEYESRAGRSGVELYVTLQRGFGRMGRTNLRRRPGPASPSVPTPDAQCLGVQRYDFAILPFTVPVGKGGAGRAPFLPAALAFLYPPIAHQADPEHILIEGARVGRRRAIRTPAYRISPANLRVSAFTRAADDDGWILRFWENGGRGTTARVTLAPVFRKVVEVTLNEEPVRRLDVKGRSVILAVGPYRIVTLKLLDS